MGQFKARSHHPLTITTTGGNSIPTVIYLFDKFAHHWKIICREILGNGVFDSTLDRQKSQKKNPNNKQLVSPAA